MIRTLVLIALVVACSKSAPEQQPAAEQKTAAAATAAMSDADLVKFCAQTYFKMMDCFKDAEFWQIFSTMYFANTNLTADDTEREHWIGVMKEDLLKLYNEHGFEKNCEATLAHNKAPSERSVKAVMAAGRQSCAAFGSAFGYMVFNEGAFHVPK